MRETLRLRARFLLAMGIVGCHGSASSDPSTAPTTTASIPAPTATTTTAATDTAPVVAPTTDAGAGGPVFPPHGGMHARQLPDGGVVYEPMPFLGRPLRVDGRARTASPLARADWRGAPEPGLEAMTAEERHALAEQWSRDAAAEHASIAAFSRFSLQLLALGAPPDLVEAAHHAALDEARHARDAYALASAFAGKPIGPAPLDVTGALAHVADVTLARLAVETFEEGCVGETFAAMAAREQHAQYTDVAVHDVLDRIADDEERHAELAWRAVAWAVRTGGAEVKDALAASLARLEALPSMARSTVFSTVIVPCAQALLAV